MFVKCLLLLGFVLLQFFSLFMELIYHEKEDSMGLTVYLKITI
jgi:hypothetical protein